MKIFALIFALWFDNSIAAEYAQCTQAQIITIERAMDDARVDIRRSINPNSLSLRMKYWFGNASELTVLTGLARIAVVLVYHDVTFVCIQHEKVRDNLHFYARVPDINEHVIFLYADYWWMPPTGIDSMASTIVHEISHFHDTANTDDHTYGVLLTSLLPMLNHSTINNACSYEYFVATAP